MTKKLELTPIGPPYPSEFVEHEIDWHQRLATLIEARWLIAAVTILAIAFGYFYAVVRTPIYRTDALLQVEQERNAIGDLTELSPMLYGQSPSETQIEIIRSRSILGTTVDQLGLDIVAEPHYFPVVGSAIARHHNSSDGLAKPWWGLRSFAWGGERIQVQRLDVPPEYEGKAFTLVAGDGNTFRLYGPNDRSLLTGHVGTTAKGEFSASPSSSNTTAANSTDTHLEIFVTELRARRGTSFMIIKTPRIEAIRALQEQLSIAEKGRNTGILQLALAGPQPQRIAATLKTISNLYLRQNVERRSEEAEKRLTFLNKQLPALKAKLETAEARLNEYRSKLGSVDLNLETQSILKQLANVETELSALQLKRTELRERFTESHPVIMTLDEKIRQLETARVTLNKQIKNMPAEAQEAIRLTRDVKVGNELYLLLLNKAQELNVMKAGTIGNARIVDPAFVPDEPVTGGKLAVISASVCLGLLLGIALAFTRKFLFRGVEDPDQLEQRIGLPTYAAIPHSLKQVELTKSHRRNHGQSTLLALREPNDLAIEGIRSLRTSLQFALINAKNNIVSIAGPSFNVGKSFISANLACVLADAGKRTLLIDADMRRGHLHHYFGADRGNGLSELTSAQVDSTHAIRKTEIDNLHFLPSGSLPPNPSELLMSDRFQQLVKKLSVEYDLLIIDTPPILAVTDAAIIGRLASINFVLLHAGRHPMREIEHAVKRLEQNGVKPQGFIFNHVPLKTGRRYNYHYQYEYSKARNG